MIFNNNGPVAKQEAPQEKKTPKANIESSKVVEAPVEAPVVEKTPTVEPKKAGSKKKAAKK